MAKRNLYLKTTPVDEALAIYLQALEGCKKMEEETIPVIEALNRITWEAIVVSFLPFLFELI